MRVSIIIMRCALEMFNEENWHARLPRWQSPNQPNLFLSLLDLSIVLYASPWLLGINEDYSHKS